MKQEGKQNAFSRNNVGNASFPQTLCDTQQSALYRLHPVINGEKKQVYQQAILI